MKTKMQTHNQQNELPTAIPPVSYKRVIDEPVCINASDCQYKIQRSQIETTKQTDADALRLVLVVLVLLVSTVTLIAKCLSLPQWLYTWGSIGMATNTAICLLILAINDLLALYAKYK